METKDIKPNKGYITAIFFLVIIMLFLAYNVWDSRQQVADLEDREARLVEERNSLRGKVDELTGEIEDMGTPVPDRAPDVERPARSLLSHGDINRLKRQGLEDPVDDITQDLLKRNDLIPHEGVLGGTMAFYSPSNIHILSPHWVFAYFEDGHIRGEMLLEYSVEDNGSLSWKVIDSYLD